MCCGLLLFIRMFAQRLEVAHFLNHTVVPSTSLNHHLHIRLYGLCHSAQKEGHDISSMITSLKHGSSSNNPGKQTSSESLQLHATSIKFDLMRLTRGQLLQITNNLLPKLNSINSVRFNVPSPLAST